MLNLGKKFSLPPDAVTQKFAFLGKSGSGKTYAAGKFVELLYEEGAQVIIVDVIGNWWGLRLAADGKKPGIKIPVIGGMHGDVPLEHTGGNIIADFIVESNTSAVIDASEFTGGELRKFVTDFAIHLLQLKKKAKSPIMIIWEECQDVVPQNFRTDSARMVGAMEKLIKQGRNYGIGTTLISQRPQAVNKDVLNQTECLIVFQTNGPQERKAIEAWVIHQGLDKKMINELPRLKTGECFVWSPSWLDIFIQTTINKKHTFDTSATPLFGTAEKARELAPIDLQNLSAQIQATIEKTKQTDPKELQKQIADLKKQLSSQKPQEVKIIEKEIMVLSEKDRELLKATKTIYDKIEAWITDIKLQPLSEKKVIQPSARKTYSPPSENRSDISLPIGEKKVLTVVGQYENGCDRNQISLLTGYKRSSRDTYIQRLAEKQLLNKSGDKITITKSGINTLGPDFEPLPTGQDLINYWYERLPAGEKIIFELLVNDFPGQLTRDEISQKTDYKRSSRDTYIQRLNTRKLISINSDGISAAEGLFF